MKLLQRIIPVAAVLAVTMAQPLVAVPSIFNGKLSAEDRKSLEAGNVVIRKLSSASDLCMESSNAGIQRCLGVAKKLKPAYVAEIIQLYPYEGNENFMDDLETLLLDIPSYAGIPYWSERAEAWYDLYSSATIRSVVEDGNAKTVLADLEMDPFGLIDTRIETEKTAGYFYYLSTNLNKLRYHDKFNCVGKEKMKSVIVAYREGDYWVLYGVGAVDAPSIFFLRDRVETSFINRIKTFCSFFFTKLKEAEAE